LSAEPVLKSIAKDARGASWSLLFPDGSEAVLIFTKKGMLRGGHSHDRPETSLLLTGRIKYWKIDLDGRETEFVHEAGQELHNAPGEIHMAEALEDYWLFDWKVGAKMGETKTTNYPPYREKVDRQLAELKA
jgi:quercetin dioxygenase-like cupin family protein